MCRGPDGDYRIDTDEQAQHVVRLVFDVFEEQGSLHGLLRYLKKDDIRMPIRPHFGANRGQLEWRRPNRMTLQNLLHHPIYAGAYRWGYRPTDPRRKIAGRRSTGRTVKTPEGMRSSHSEPVSRVHLVGAVSGVPEASGRQPRSRRRDGRHEKVALC